MEFKAQSTKERKSPLRSMEAAGDYSVSGHCSENSIERRSYSQSRTTPTTKFMFFAATKGCPMPDNIENSQQCDMASRSSAKVGASVIYLIKHTKEISDEVNVKCTNGVENSDKKDQRHGSKYSQKLDFVEDLKQSLNVRSKSVVEPLILDIDKEVTTKGDQHVCISPSKLSSLKKQMSITKLKKVSWKSDKMHKEGDRVQQNKTNEKSLISKDDQVKTHSWFDIDRPKEVTKSTLSDELKSYFNKLAIQDEDKESADNNRIVCTKIQEKECKPLIVEKINNAITIQRNPPKSVTQCFTFKENKVKSSVTVNQLSAVPMSDPKVEYSKSVTVHPTIKVLDNVSKKKPIPEQNDNAMWNLDEEDLKLVRKQPYLFKRLKRLGNGLPIADLDGSSKSGFVSNETKDQPTKNITFADAPEYFKLKLCDDVPESEVPSTPSLSQLRIDQKDKYFDDVALALCQKSISTFETLIFQLIDANVNVKSDIDRVRAVFTWLTNKNTTEAHFDYLNGQESQEGNRESPDMYLHGLCTGRYTYAQFFQLICKLAGMRCKLLRGYAKGNDFKPGMKLDGGKAAQHAWNSVEIDGIWYLFDTHWTARRLTGRNTAQNKSSPTKLDLFYFMIHPDDMTYSHFPFEGAWQLLKEPISLETFEKMAIVKPAFFKYGLKFVNYKEAIVSTQKDVKLDIEYPSTSGNGRLAFTYTIQIEGQASETITDVPLTRFGIQETVIVDEKTSVVRFWIRFPESGSYKIMIFAKAIEDALFSGVCEYLVQADIDQNHSKVIPFPPAQQTCYGKTDLLAKYNISSSWDDQSIISLSKSTFEITFKTTKGVTLLFSTERCINHVIQPEHSNCPRLMARLKKHDRDDNDMSQRLLIRIIAPTVADYKNGIITSEIIKIKGYLPENGEYALEIYANNPDIEASSFFLIWQHILILETEMIETNVPKLSPGFILGAQERFKELSLQAVTNPDPLILIDGVSNNHDADLSIRISLPIGRILTSDISKKEGIRILGQLLDATQGRSDDEKDCSNLLLQQSYTHNKSSYEVEFLIRLDGTSAFHKLYIYAMSLDSDLDTLPLAMTFLIHLDSDLSHNLLKGVEFGEFPQQTSQWKEDCRLITPMRRVLTLLSADGDEKSEQMFRLIVPHAMKVAGVINDDWFQFTKSEDDLWTRTIQFASSIQSGSTLTLFANFNSRYNSYIPLLEYVLQQ